MLCSVHLLCKILGFVLRHNAKLQNVQFSTCFKFGSSSTIIDELKNSAIETYAGKILADSGRERQEFLFEGGFQTLDRILNLMLSLVVVRVFRCFLATFSRIP